MRNSLLSCLALVLAFSAQAPAQTPGEEASEKPSVAPVTGIDFPLVTHHEGEFNGIRVAYSATIDGLVVSDAEGNAGAHIVGTAYVADVGGAAKNRPVVFMWNGGPISPSVYLHMGAFGPKRVAFSDDLETDSAKAPLVDNPHSILDVADLVFFDPAGTGFSRAVPGKELEDYFSVAADAQQTAAYIAAWLQANDRAGSPVYILGESYGTNRAVEVARHLAGLEAPVLLDGVVLFGQAVNIIEYAQRPHNIISYAVSLPTLAAIGWHHGKASTNGASLDDFVATAWNYARDDYLEALFLGNRLAPESMRQVAERLEEFSGLRAEVFVENRLRVSKELYRVELFKEEGLMIGRADGRYTGPAEAEAEEEEGEGEEDASPPDPSAALPRRLAQAFADYLVSDLGAPSAEQYLVDSPVSGLDAWGWGGQSPFARFDYGDGLDPLFEKNPEARVQVWAGYFDTMTTIGASWYLADQETWPSKRVTVNAYRGGHMAYSIEDSVRRMAEDLRAFVQNR